MPFVYSSVFQNFIRSGFSKSFTYGYAQSVVAATHPHVLNSQNRPSFGRRSTYRTASRISAFGFHAAFHSGTHAAGPTEPRYNHDKTYGHGGLDAYFEQLQKTEAEAAEEAAEQEWVQFQFPKRIEWKPTPASMLLAPLPQGPELETTERDDELVNQPGAHAALTYIDAALEKEIQCRERSEDLHDEVASTGGPCDPVKKAQIKSATPLSRAQTPASPARTAIPPVDPQSIAYAEHLTKLSEAARYAEVPAIFEAMLISGVRPTSEAYNALLVAAIHVPSEKIEVVAKALDVYADMLRRKVSPDSDTYNILVGLLAARSLEVSALKHNLEEKRVRFGGMDEPGKFMLASHELEHAILCEDDRLDLALQLFQSSVCADKALYSSKTYHQIIKACAQAGRVSDMLLLFEHMESNRGKPFAATFPAMITAFASSGDLVSAVECYNEYRNLAIAHDAGEPTLHDRLDAQVYAAIINAYVVSDKAEGALKFYRKIVNEYGDRVADIKDALVKSGFVKGFVYRGIYDQALQWAQLIENETRGSAMSEIATMAADKGDKRIAVSAFAKLATPADLASPAMALLALSVREGDVTTATQYWQILSRHGIPATPSFIEPTIMYAVAMIASGQVAQGLVQSDAMFQRIRDYAIQHRMSVSDEIDEGLDFIAQFMSSRAITDPRELSVSPVSQAPRTLTTASPFASHSSVGSSQEDTFDPYAHSTDFRGSSLISDELDGSQGRKGPWLNAALHRFRNIRRAGRHPRYITYSKLISAAAREGKMEICNEILAMARSDVPLLPQYAVVRYGWSSILDAMVAASLNAGNRAKAEQYHQELLAMGAMPSANTYGLYITSLKDSANIFDEASEAVKIFHRARAEGVEPSSFLYNALIGKLGKARRIDDCLFYFGEMRGLGIKPTSVTYGTVVNALCRVSDEKFAEELFDEMELMPHYKARPAPYNSMMQFFLITKRDRAKVLVYYERMQKKGIRPTVHTYKLLIETHATLEPTNMSAAEAVLDLIRASGQRPDAVHYAALIHARGCALHDMAGARGIFDAVMKDTTVVASPCLFQALFEAMVANHQVAETQKLLVEMRRMRLEMTPYIANTLIHGWAAEKNIAKAREMYSLVPREKREPSTYEAMTRAYLALEEREMAKQTVSEMLTRGYPNAVVNRVLELLGGGSADPSIAVA